MEEIAWMLLGGLNPSHNPEDQDKENLIKAKLDLIKQETIGQLMDIQLTVSITLNGGR